MAIKTAVQKQTPLTRSAPRDKRKKQHLNRQAHLDEHTGSTSRMVGVAICEQFDLPSIARDQSFNEEYIIGKVVEGWEQVLYLSSTLPGPSVTSESSVSTTYASTHISECFIFNDGVLVFVNMPVEQQRHIQLHLRPYGMHFYDSSVVRAETDDLPFTIRYAGGDVKAESEIVDDTLHLTFANADCDVNSVESIIDRIAFAHGIAVSVKIGVLEDMVNNIASVGDKSLLQVVRELRSQKVILKEGQVLAKLGELGHVRHHLNLQTDLVAPDAYWANVDLERMYANALSYFDVERRCSVLNRQIDYCENVLDNVDRHLSNLKSHRLEWIIIWLILIEVIIGISQLASGTSPAHHITPALLPHTPIKSES